MVDPSAIDTPRVAVVIIFLNAERFLEQAIESVLVQTIQEWELLLVDDGSTDSSPEIAEGYAASLPGKVRLLCHPGRANRGTAASRNLGVIEARAPYVAFLDSDDVYEPNRLERHLIELDRAPGIAAVISADTYWYSWSAESSLPHVPDRRIGLAALPGRCYEPPSLIVGTLLTRGAHMPATCGVTMRRQVFVDFGGIPEEFCRHYEDQVLFCKLLLSRRVFVIGDALARYRQHPASITSGNASLVNGPGSPAMIARGRFLRWLAQYLQDAGCDLPELATWIESELVATQAAAQSTRRGLTARTVGKRLVAAAGRALPAWLVQPVYACLHGLTGWDARRRAMGMIQRHERKRAANQALPGAR